MLCEERPDRNQKCRTRLKLNLKTSLLLITKQNKITKLGGGGEKKIGTKAMSTLIQINLKTAFSSKNAPHTDYRFQAFPNCCSSTLKRYVPVLCMGET